MAADRKTGSRLVVDALDRRYAVPSSGETISFVPLTVLSFVTGWTRAPAVAGYLDFILNQAFGVQRHRFIRELFALAGRIPNSVFLQAVEPPTWSASRSTLRSVV